MTRKTVERFRSRAETAAFATVLLLAVAIPVLQNLAGLPSSESGLWIRILSGVAICFAGAGLIGVVTFLIPYWASRGLAGYEPKLWRIENRVQQCMDAIKASRDRGDENSADTILTLSATITALRDEAAHIAGCLIDVRCSQLDKRIQAFRLKHQALLVAPTISRRKLQLHQQRLEQLSADIGEIEDLAQSYADNPRITERSVKMRVLRRQLDFSEGIFRLETKLLIRETESTRFRNEARREIDRQ
ncbi:MAG: hypothetical protein BWY68_00026 [bacterium ADurb.Bin400]|nr:MAG: hypothetical protein BWY68_00026 [bacterium ADurb.Bin400]